MKEVEEAKNNQSIYHQTHIKSFFFVNLNYFKKFLLPNIKYKKLLLIIN